MDVDFEGEIMAADDYGSEVVPYNMFALRVLESAQSMSGSGSRVHIRDCSFKRLLSYIIEQPEPTIPLCLYGTVNNM